MFAKQIDCACMGLIALGIFEIGSKDLRDFPEESRKPPAMAAWTLNL